MKIVYNLALRIDPNSLMHAAAFQLIRNVLHGCGTVIALRPEDNSAAATVEIVEAALASLQPEERIAQRCRIPAIVSELRIERAESLETPEHELLGDILEAQAASVAARAAKTAETAKTRRRRKPPRESRPPRPSLRARSASTPPASMR